MSLAKREPDSREDSIEIQSKRARAHFPIAHLNRIVADTRSVRDQYSRLCSDMWSREKTRGWNPQIATILIAGSSIQSDPAILNYISVIRCNHSEIRSQPQENGAADVIFRIEADILLSLWFSINYILYYMNRVISFAILRLCFLLWYERNFIPKE